ncbi:microcin-processing peptidase 1. Unknown type peptidase. MEROPS family U62 [Bryocella elongata]|uniref:PmbA protein n=1 Tax=Bryocella elongata TaxID=863522 RepID=A0A1H6AK54_9BACT|nr:TldD/PmbA family protein [Bryocella elongata]SEG48395.1 microcin-processing peptidase 1. Unknown type peptidase. MEROPS family U62 [Bryocella elongata]
MDFSIQPAERAQSLNALAQQAVERALAAGACDAEAVAFAGEEFAVHVRMGQVEQLTESGSRAVGLRVFFESPDGQRTASTSTSDLSEDGLKRLIDGAVGLARVTGADPFAGLPERELLAQPSAKAIDDLCLYFDDVDAIPAQERIEIARRCEAAALAHDTRIQNSVGADFDASTAHRVMVNSRGFRGEYRRSYCGFSVTPIAQDASGAMQRDYWYSSARTARLLDSPESVGRKAAERALRRLGARRVPTQKCPVVYAPEVARSLMGNLLSAADGDSIYRNASMFAGKLGEQVGGENITMVDDGTMVFEHSLGGDKLFGGQQGSVRVGGFGTSPYDGDGLPTRRTVVIERGILKQLMLNTYTGRKLNMASTGKASRGLAGAPGIGGGNYFLEPGTLTPEQIIADIPQGLYVLSTMGFGVNLVNGDYSLGVSGLWIDGGELAYPVEEITIAGNLKDMFRNVTAIGNDLEFRGSGAVPTVRIDGMTVAGS